MEILLWVVLGAVAGWLASIIMGTNMRQGLFMDIVMGMIGAVVGGFLMGFFGQPGVTGFNLYSVLIAVLGAVVVIYIGRMFRKTI